MSTGTTKAPNLPAAPKEYSSQYMEQLNNVLRLYFTTLDNAGACVMSTERRGASVISALNFSQPDVAANVRVLSLPNQTDLANLRVGDVYVDTSAGNVLKVKP
jgi:hypothetical protein